MAIQDAITSINRFKGSSLAETVASFESMLAQANKVRAATIVQSAGVDQELLMAAAAVKRASAQIDVVIHTAGILYALPHLLHEGEVIKALSLGAGSAGSEFDLETDQRIAEFKFIRWQGGSESVRKKTLFQDYYKLVREPTCRRKYLYLLNTEIPLRFLNGRSAIKRVLDRNKQLAEDFANDFGQTYRTVGEFFAAHEGQVHLVNLVEVVPGFDVFLAGPE